MKLWSHVVQGHSRHTCHRKEFWQNVVHWRRKWKLTPAFFLGETQAQYEKQKKIWHWNMSFQSQKVSNMLLGKSRRQLLIAPKRIKWLGQSKNEAQLWMCLMVKIKSDAIKKNIAYKLEMLGPRIRVNWMWSNRNWQEWTSTSQWTKMDENRQI